MRGEFRSAARSGDDDGDEEMTTDDEPAAPKTRLDPPLNNPSQTGDNSLRLLFKTIVFSTLCVNC